MVSVEDGGTFEVILHRVWRGSAIDQDFLGFYVLDSHRMSARTHGLLGMADEAGRAEGWAVEASGLVTSAAGHQDRPTSNMASGLRVPKRACPGEGLVP